MLLWQKSIPKRLTRSGMPASKPSSGSLSSSTPPISPWHGFARIVARKVLKILNQVVDDPQLIKIKSSGVPTTEDIRQRRLELDKLLQTPPVDEEIARQKAMELAVLTLVSVEMEEYEAHRLRSIFGKQAKMRELDANLLRQSVRKVTYGSKTVKVLLKNNQVLEECDDA